MRNVGRGEGGGALVRGSGGGPVLAFALPLVAAWPFLLVAFSWPPASLLARVAAAALVFPLALGFAFGTAGASAAPPAAQAAALACRPPPNAGRTGPGTSAECGGATPLVATTAKRMKTI